MRGSCGSDTFFLFSHFYLQLITKIERFVGECELINISLNSSSNTREIGTQNNTASNSTEVFYKAKIMLCRNLEHAIFSLRMTDDLISREKCSIILYSYSTLSLGHI